MKTFRCYEKLIRKTVDEINSEDSNYNWSVHSFAKDKVTLNWSYLDKNDGYFSIKIMNPIETHDDEVFITSVTPFGEMINGHIVSENPVKVWQESYEKAIKNSIYECFNYANTRY